MKAKSFQEKLKQTLEGYFSEVEKEWTVSKNATDTFSANSKRYSPRLDIAVGPFNVTQGNRKDEIERKFSNEIPRKLKTLLNGLSQNPNPRCGLAIEISFSGSSKHILGDITTASMMGLYGLVITNNKTSEKANRIFEYVKTLKGVGKMPGELFENVRVVKYSKLSRLLKN